MNPLITYFLARLSERSTWQGLIGLASLVGITIAPQYISVISVIGVGVVSFISVVTKDPQNVTADVNAAVTDIVIPAVEAVSNTNVQSH